MKQYILYKFWKKLKIDKTGTTNIYRKKVWKDILRLNLFRLYTKTFNILFDYIFWESIVFSIKIIEHGYTYLTITFNNHNYGLEDY